ncbi:MAG: minor capsid protein [Desulfovibrionaceae bacterium]|nr:minor capsid protein [Desulfovibrionaceae bacterium]
MTTREQLDRYFMVRALLWNQALEQIDAATVASVIKTLNAVREDVRAQLLQNANTITDWRADRLAQVGAWASEVLASASATVSTSITEAAVISATASLAEYNAMLSLDGAAAGVSTVGFTKEQLVTWFRDTPIFEDMSLTTRVNNAMSAGAKDAILEAIRKAGVEGEGTADIVQRAITAGVDAGFQLTEREAVTLARTYVQTANVQAQDAVMQANRHLLKGWRWMAKLSNKTCPVCAALDGNFYTFDEPSPPMPRHYRCRCLRQWVTNNPRDFGLPDDEIQRLTRPWVERKPGSIGTGGMKIANAGTTKEFYGGWFNSLPAKQQDAILGPRRAVLLRDGKIQWGDLADKGTGRLRTLPELVDKSLLAERRLPDMPLAKTIMPNADMAYVQKEKIVSYALNPEHKTGGNKARVLMAAFGLTPDDAGEFAESIRNGLPKGNVTKQEETERGEKFTVEIPFTGKNGHTENITTGWIYDQGKQIRPRLTTAYLEGKKKGKR